MKLFPNGIIIQETSRPTNYIAKINYRGANAYHSEPLLGIDNVVCKRLSDEASFIRHADGSCTPKEFISDIDLASRYISQCRDMNIGIRVLFVESEYCEEIWNAPLPKLSFLGYEYSPIPFDCQVITDMDWYTPLHSFFPMLNQNGLFDSHEDILLFKEAYDAAVLKGDIGDDMETFICKIYEVII